MSRTIKFAKAGGPEVLEFLEVQVPAPGPNEVRIKVKAIGINRAEAMWRVDDYIEPVKKFPAGLGYEAAGIVDAVGKDVSGFAAGDEVNVIPSFSLNDYATYGEVVLVPDHAVVRQPKALSFTEAASIWMMFVTAYGALIEDAKVTKGHGAAVQMSDTSVVRVHQHGSCRLRRELAEPIPRSGPRWRIEASNMSVELKHIECWVKPGQVPAWRSFSGILLTPFQEVW
jgi:NADPH:quinone reductase-like Zn-dependent oxidoreductase